MLFPYCEHLRNFEFKYNLFQRYVDFSKNFLDYNNLEADDEDDDEGLDSQASPEPTEEADVSAFEDLITEDMMEPSYYKFDSVFDFDQD